MRADTPWDFLGRSSVWIGEALYNLRGALDYLAYCLACAGNGYQHVPNTQFPICDDWDDFIAKATGRHPRTGKKVTCRLPYVPQPAIDRIGQLQPGATPPCEWTGRLRDLSNPDKHQSLASLKSVSMLRRGDHPDLADIPLPPEARTPDQYHFVVGIFFKDTDDDVVDTLKVLQSQVRTVIEEFKPSFEWPV